MFRTNDLIETREVLRAHNLLEIGPTCECRTIYIMYTLDRKSEFRRRVGVQPCVTLFFSELRMDCFGIRS